jgi:two-component system phosphate regulon sensor histidine kinase PhoR
MKLNKQKIIILIISITAALAGLIVIQVKLLKDSYDQKEQVFNRNVISALNSTAKMLEVNETEVNIINYAVTSLSGKSRKLHSPNALSLKSENRKTEMIVLSNDDDKVKVHVKTGPGRKKTDSVSYSYSFNIPSGKDKILPENFNLDTLTHNRVYKFFSDEGGKKTVSSYSYYDIVDSLKGLDSLHKKQMVSGVMDKLILADRTPIEKRISRSQIDSLLKLNFRNYGINIDFNYGVITQMGDSSKLVLCDTNKTALEKSELKALLYPSDILPFKNFLTVVFPGSRYFFYKLILPQLILSAVFILIIIGSFVYTIRIIFLQKKFGGLIMDFINNMTHEFKTPISTIALASDAIAQPEINNNEEKLKKYNRIIQDENSRMKQQVDKILQMALLEEGDYELNLSVIDLHELINNAVGNLSVRVENLGGKLETNLSASNYRIKGDVVHLINIINNILDNAIKYSPEGAHIIVQTHNEGSKIILSFIDNGMGIDEDDLKRVFDKYFRVPTGNLHDIKGFGLGLSYVKLMVEGHSGEIKIKSKPGIGTTVDITLPVIKEIQ